MFFYLIFPQILAFIKFKQMQPGKLLALSGIIWLFTQAILTNLLNSPFYKPYPSIPNDLLFYFPVSHFSSFLLGIVGAYLYLDVREKGLPICVIVPGLVFSFAGCFVALNYGDWVSRQVGLELPFPAGMASPLLLALILFSSFFEKRFSGKWLNNRVLNLLGQASYAMFIFQLPFHKFYSKYLSLLVNAKPELDFYYYLAFLVLFSIAINKCFETPVRRLLFEKF
jgi:peptidoglycan/LPS O-acetylase OafA/YrhL